MSNKLRTFIFMLSVCGIAVGFKTGLRAFEDHQVSNLTNAIKNKRICNMAENIMECSHAEFLRVAKHFADPRHGQEFLTEIVKEEIEKSPEKARFLKDQYYIFTANLYIRSLKQPQKSLVSRIPVLGKHNVDVQVAKAFLQGMSDYSNRREIDRTIASETILQEVSNFNATLDELTKVVDGFQ